MSITITRFPVMRFLLASVVAAVGLAGFSSVAQAACSYPDAEQVFAKWGDSSYYELAPDGGFEEGGLGWTFTGGAEVVAGNESEFLNGPEDETSLRIPYGGMAISPKVCVDESTPHFRLMALNGGDKNAKLRVLVTYELSGEERTRDSDVRAEDEWEPTKPLKLESDGAVERVARISFTPKDDDGDWLIDDLYIDPFSRR
jgi:hypothetical protein